MPQAPYFTYKNYMKQTYGTTLYTIPVDLDLGCPNRDEDNKGGCTFCPENGARAAQILEAKDIEDQIIKAISFSKNRYKAEDFLLYIQAYTGTFTQVQNQKEIYSKLLSFYNFKAISIGTRPDCLNKKTLEYLKHLNKQIDVYIDLGVQTFNDKTLKKINRGHDSKSTKEAIKSLKEYGIKVFAHIIVGFKGETRKDWLNSVNEVVRLDVDGIKIHNLHIIKNTKLHEEYKNKEFKTYMEYEYAEELIFLIRNIPEHIPIIRLSTDTPKNDLVAPLWNMQKGEFVEFINESMIYAGFKQADLLKNTIQETIIKKQNSFNLEDGSITIWDKKYKDYYHPKSGAIKQAREFFIKQSKLKEKLEKKDINLLDIGFGMGYNSLEAIKIEKKHKLKITALDKNRMIIKEAATFLEDSKQKEMLNTIFEKFIYSDEFNTLKFIVAEARYSITKLKEKFDIVFLDSFLPNLNPSLVSYDFVILIKKVLKRDGVVLCSQNNALVRNAFLKAGFSFEEFEIEKSDIKGLVLKLGKSYYEESFYKDPYLINREKQIITNFEQKQST